MEPSLLSDGDFATRRSRRRDPLASMEPSLLSDGDTQFGIDGGFVINASMEPSLLSDGDVLDEIEEVAGELASMEPSLLSDGDARSTCSSSRPVSLQWSRRFSATETATRARLFSPRRRFNGAVASQR